MSNTFSIPLTTTGPFLLINKQGLLMEIFHLLQMQFHNTLFEQMFFIAAVRYIWKTQEECLQNSQTKSMTTHRQCQAQFHPLQITLCISLCKQDVSSKQGSPALGWNITLHFFRKKSDAVRHGNGDKGGPGGSNAQQSCWQHAQGLLELLSLCHPYTVGCKC